MASQLTLFGDSTVNIKSTRRAFGFFLPAEYAVMYRATKEASRFWGCGQFLPFKVSLLSAYWVLSAYFLADKRMRLLTRVYGTSIVALFRRWGCPRRTSTKKCYFCGVLIFVIFVTSPGVTKLCTHEVFHLRYKLLVLLLR